jgi:hypothetical protein
MWFTFPPMGEPLIQPDQLDAVPATRASHDAVVRPISRAAQRRCARPGCPAPAGATLRFDYAAREAWIDSLLDEPEPQSYDLCGPHVGRTQAPYGWRLRDRRSDDDRREDAPPATPADLGSERTVAVLAAALRAVPATAPESGDERTPRVTQVPRQGAGAAAAAGAPDLRPASAAAEIVGGASQPADVPHREDAASPILGGRPGSALDW